VSYFKTHIQELEAYSQEIEIGRVDALLVRDAIVVVIGHCLQSDRDLDAVTLSILWSCPTWAASRWYNWLIILHVVGHDHGRHILQKRKVCFAIKNWMSQPLESIPNSSRLGKQITVPHLLYLDQCSFSGLAQPTQQGVRQIRHSPILLLLAKAGHLH